LFVLYNTIKETKNEAKLVELMEKKDLLPDQSNNAGQTPLMFAIDENFKQETILKLIELGCDVNAVNKEDGMTCLHLAVLLEQIEIFKLLLSMGADHNIADIDGETVEQLC